MFLDSAPRLSRSRGQTRVYLGRCCERAVLILENCQFCASENVIREVPDSIGPTQLLLLTNNV